MLGLECEGDAPLDGEDPDAGEIFGRVRVDQAPRTLARQVSIATIPDAECPGNRSAIVMARDRIEVNFTCETPDPLPGAMSGLVTVHGVPTGQFTMVLIRDPDGTIAAEGTVAADGSFGFETSPPGCTSFSFSSRTVPA